MSKAENKPFLRQKLILEYIIQLVQDRPNQETFYIDKNNIHDIDPLLKDSTSIELVFKKITEDTKKNIIIRFQRTGEKFFADNKTFTDLEVFVHVHDKNLLSKHLSDLLEGDTPEFTLHKDGRLTINGDESGCCYPMDIESFRFELLEFLSQKKKLFSAEQLAEEFAVSKDKIKKTIGSIKKLIKKHLNVPTKHAIDNNKETGAGYIVTNIQIKK